MQNKPKEHTSASSLLKALSGTNVSKFPSRKASILPLEASVYDAIIDENSNDTIPDTGAVTDAANAIELANAERDREGEARIAAIDEREMKRRIDGLPIPFELLKKGLSCIGPSPNGLRHVFHRLSLPNAGLETISFMQKYTFLQKLELPGNGIKDIDSLNHLHYLVTLDLSNNEIMNFKLETPPFNLQELDLSRNKLSEMGEFRNYRFLKHLALDYNHISEISGLENCKVLSCLMLSHNSISRIQGLESLPLKFLDISSNVVESLDGLETLSRLQSLNLSNNVIEQLAPSQHWNPENHPSIHHLNLSENNISDTEQLAALQSLTLLRNLNFSGNPITKSTFDIGEFARAYSNDTLNALSSQNSFAADASGNYRLHLYYILPFLTCLDGLVITSEEKVSSLNRFHPPGRVVDAIRHACSVQRDFKLYAKIKYSQTGKLVVICGPAGAGKRTLTKRLLADFPQLFGAAISHTTRKARSKEVDGVHYHFISRIDMKRMISRGKFIVTSEVNGSIYATTIEAVNNVFKEGKICVLDLELEGLESVRRQNKDAKVIYVTVPSLEILKARLKMAKASASLCGSSEELNLISRPSAVRQIELFSTMHKYQQSENKEKYDLKIFNDDFEQSYLHLKRAMLAWEREGRVE